MSKELLYNLNNNKNGHLKSFLDQFMGEPRIAWYPSAGQDFRALLYLTDNYSKHNPGSKQDPPSPDLFLFTDYFPWSSSKFLDSKTIYKDDRTIMSVESIEELPKLQLPLHSEIIDFPEGSKATNRVLFLNVKIESDRLGNMSFPVLYAFAENETFYCQKLIPNKAIISHIVHIRYGGGLGGGGKSSGVWLINVLKKLNCEIFITDGHHNWQSGDRYALEMCSEIPKQSHTTLTRIRKIRGYLWSEHGDVSWNLVE